MFSQKSYQVTESASSSGVLYLVGTPIGNLEDMTLRALRVLREVDVIAAEDTRHTRKLLNHFEISAKLKSYHEHNKHESGKQILQYLQEGRAVALVSDAGMPAISDPGFDLVQLVLQNDGHVVAVPGVNAALTALVVSGLQTDCFSFVGFLPRDKKRMKKTLESWKNHAHTLIFYESPHRLLQMLNILLEILGDRKIAVGRELTKKFEEIVRGRVSETIEYFTQHGVQGECCLIVEGQDEVVQMVKAPVDVIAQVGQFIQQGWTEKEAIREVAKQSGMAKRDIYNKYVSMKNK